MTIQAIVGLGNPGEKYDRTRHNAGFWFVDELAVASGGQFREESKLHGAVCAVTIAGQPLRLLKPDTFMNNSGRAIQALAAYFKLPAESILVVHDELDLPPGTARLKRSGGHGGHNGLRDTIAHIGADFCRLRIGIGHPGDRSQVLNYVLGRASLEEQQAIDLSINRALESTRTMFEKDWHHAIHQLHSKSVADQVTKKES